MVLHFIIFSFSLSPNKLIDWLIDTAKRQRTAVIGRIWRHLSLALCCMKRKQSQFSCGTLWNAASGLAERCVVGKRIRNFLACGKTLAVLALHCVACRAGWTVFALCREKSLGKQPRRYLPQPEQNQAVTPAHTHIFIHRERQTKI